MADIYTKSTKHRTPSTKCFGAGNGRKQSIITKKLRRQLNKRRRKLILSEINSSQKS